MNTIKFPVYVILQNINNDRQISILPFKYFIFDHFYLEITDWIDADGIALKFKFKISFNNSAVKQVETEKGGEYPLLDFTIYEDGDFVGRFAWFVFDHDYIQGKMMDITSEKALDTSMQENTPKNKMVFMCLKLILFCLSYIMNYPREHKQTQLSSHRYSHEHRVSTKQNKIYLFDDIVKYVSDNYIPENGHHNIQCPCWEVRGHYRHYKSGKVIFIPSYRKGKQRNTAQPKNHEYYV